MQVELYQGGRVQTDPAPKAAPLYSPESLRDPQQQEISKAVDLIREMFGCSLDKEAVRELLQDLYQKQSGMSANSSNLEENKKVEISKAEGLKKQGNITKVISAAEIADFIKASVSSKTEELSFEEHQRLKDLVEYMSEGVQVSVFGASFHERGFWQEEKRDAFGYKEKDDEEPLYARAA